MQESEIKVGCPCCRNGRLLDVEIHTEGKIQIKCPICRGVIQIILHNTNIRTERIATH
jgi:phage FluMu protein Com